MEVTGKPGEADSTLDNVRVAEPGFCSASQFSPAPFQDCYPMDMTMDDTF